MAEELQNQFNLGAYHRADGGAGDGDDDAEEVVEAPGEELETAAEGVPAASAPGTAAAATGEAVANPLYFARRLRKGVSFHVPNAP